MKKKIFLLTMLFFVAFLSSCDFYNPVATVTNTPTTTGNPYETWIASDDAIDLNGDRVINEDDYNLFKLQNDYVYWKASDQAFDFNGDRKIDETDFEIYKLHNYYDYWFNSNLALDLNDDGKINETDFEIFGNYDSWVNSDFAEDLNDDSIIDVDDYEVYIEYEEFVGDYYITNYTYDGSAAYIFEDGVSFTDLGNYLSQIMITINSKGEFSVFIPENVKIAFTDNYSIILEAANNMTISRISPFVVVIDTVATVADSEVNFTLYLDENQNGDGYSTSYVIGFYDDNPVITFDVIKAE